MTDTNKARDKAFARALDATIARSSDAVKAACSMSTPSGADVLARLDSVHAKLLEYTTEGGHPSSHEAEDYHDARTAVATLIEREAALTAAHAATERDACLQAERANELQSRLAALTTERDALAAEVKALRAAYQQARNAAAGFSNYCPDSANSRRCERDLDEAERMFRAIGTARASAATGCGNG